MKVLVTGASGFVGGHIVDYFSAKGVNVTLLGRKDIHAGRFTFYKTDFMDHSSYGRALEGADVVVHCAARAHVMNDDAIDPMKAFRAFNVDATLGLARAAAYSGVKRFIFLSSIKVNGESTGVNSPFTAFDNPRPAGPYGLSKLEAEIGLKKIAQKTGMEFVIIRPPLVYGPGVKANFASLISLVEKRIPLPFAMITQNKRSLVSVINLADLIHCCLGHPDAKNKTFLVSDDDDISTFGMVRLLADACGKKCQMLPIPPFMFKLIGKLFNRDELVNRLIGSLSVDIRFTKSILGWMPPQKMRDGFGLTFRSSKKD